jgi:hypothetical protein
VERRSVLSVDDLLAEFRAELEQCMRENMLVWRAEEALNGGGGAGGADGLVPPPPGVAEAVEERRGADVGVWDYQMDRLRLRIDVRSLVEYHMGDAGPEWRPRTYNRVSRMINMLR